MPGAIDKADGGAAENGMASQALEQSAAQSAAAQPRAVVDPAQARCPRSQWRAWHQRCSPLSTAADQRAIVQGALIMWRQFLALASLRIKAM
jgi:hypothetical protein